MRNFPRTLLSKASISVNLLKYVRRKSEAYGRFRLSECKLNTVRTDKARTELRVAQ